MTTFFILKKQISTLRKTIFATFALLLSAFTLLSFSACKKEINYFSYVSEVCDNILVAENDVLSVRVYAVNRETPYIADGIPRERTARAEFFIVAPAGDKDCTLYFETDNKTWGGDTSYDGVKAQYYYSCSVDISNTTELACKIKYGESEYTLVPKSVKTDKTLSAQTVLERLRTAKPDAFSALTDEYGFAGEIYIRMLHEESLYYYVGITDRDGKTHAFLLNAQTGKVLAERKA